MSTTSVFGTYGGRYVPETLIPALDELERGWREALADDAFHAELHAPRDDVRRPPDAAHARERFAPGKRIYLKREDLLHTGAHKLNNALGQAVLARRLGKQRIVAETGAGQHGVATATVCATLRLRVRRLHGRGRHAPAEAERRAHGPARRRGAPRRLRHEDAEGSDERGDPRLDHERRDDALPDRLVRRPRAVPGARRRAAVRDRPRGARAAASRAEGRLPEAVVAVRRRRLERDRHVPRLPRRRGRASHRRRGGGRGVARHRPARRAARRALVDPRRRGRADRRRALDLGRPRLSGRRPRARVPARRRPRRVRRRDRRRGAARVPRPRAHRGDHPRARAGARARPRARARRGADPRLPLAAAATRTSPRCSRGLEKLA